MFINALKRFTALIIVLSTIFLSGCESTRLPKNDNHINIKYFSQVRFIDHRVPALFNEIPSSDIQKYFYYQKVTLINKIIRRIESFNDKGEKRRDIVLDEKGLLVKSETYEFSLNGKRVTCEMTKKTGYKQICKSKKRIKGGNQRG